MDETPSDSGELPDNSTANDELTARETESGEVKASVVPPPTVPRAVSIGAQIRRPAIWGLLVLIAAVLVAQVWLLYL